MVVDSKTELAFESNAAHKRLSRIISAPSKAPRGKKGDVYLDEVAHYVNDREVYRGSIDRAHLALPRTALGLQHAARSSRHLLGDRRRGAAPVPAPAVADQHGAVRRDEEDALTGRAMHADVQGRDLAIVELDDRRSAICRVHPHPEDEVDQHGLRLEVAGISERFRDVPAVQRGLEPLQRQALAGALRPDEHREIAELEIHVLEVREVLDLQSGHCWSLMTSYWHRPRVLLSTTLLHAFAGLDRRRSMR